MGLVQVTLSPASVAAATAAQQTFAVQGLAIGDVVQVTKPALLNSVAVVHARVSAANTLALTFVNPTAGALVPTAGEVYTVLWFRPEVGNPAVLPGAVQV